MTTKHRPIRFCVFLILIFVPPIAIASGIAPVQLRCEYLDNPVGIDETTPRLSWRLESDQRAQSQSAYQIRVASTIEALDAGEDDLWDSGKIESNESLHIVYQGRPLESRQHCHWCVRTWDQDGRRSEWSEPASWSMGLLEESDWSAEYISYLDQTPLATDTKTLFLPAARQYRKDFAADKEIKRATLYATALGIYELYLNGSRVGDAYFSPGWTDYQQRAYYNTFDVTSMVSSGDNAIGAWVADGWYSGYVGFGLLTGMGTEKMGRYTYGKTPSVMAQLEIEYTDGTQKTIKTDRSWKVTDEGPIQEADLLMGEAYDARREQTGWSETGFDDSHWRAAVLAYENTPVTADFYEGRDPRDSKKRPKVIGEPRDLGFMRPRLESFPGVPVRVTEEIAAVSVTEREPGTFVFDLGQNFAGVIRLKLHGEAGHRVQLRYGEMLHPDGRLMTENLRKARAQDFYTCKGDPDGEVYQPRFTFHGFQYVEVVNFPGDATSNAVTGLVMHSDTPMTSTFQCSDPMVNQLFKNVLWTQRANFLDLPTDCPQRDERMGWTGDAQAYVGTATYNADIGAFYTKWLRELMESQRPDGAFPGYAPFPFQHGWSFGSAWADAGVICPWTIWQAYGDTRVIETCWEPMTKFMRWRQKASVDDLGISHGNAWGDWLAQGASTPLEYVDTVYLAISAKMMSEMAEAIGREGEAQSYREQFNRTKSAFAETYLNEDGSVNVNTQTAQALALFADLIPADKRESTGSHLASMIAKNGNHMSTGFLGTRPLLPVLSDAGQHDLATFLLQTHEFPSWGYEIDNGATTIWERWDSYTKEDAFGRHNAAMNSFSHYAFGAVCEWMFRTLAGIESDGPGYKKVTIRPRPPAPGSNAEHDPIHWVRASYDSIRGTIRSDWKLDGEQFFLDVTIPANTTATVYLPTDDSESITESGEPLANSQGVELGSRVDGFTQLQIGSGQYRFACRSGVDSAEVALRSSKPEDISINPEGIDLSKAQELVRWNFDNPEDLARWSTRHDVEVERRGEHTFLVAAGPDSQIATKLEIPVRGKLVIELRAKPEQGATSQFFWASPSAGFNGKQVLNRRRLMATDSVNSYLFSLQEDAPIGKLRFDPFAVYDKYAQKSEMLIESIAIYQWKQSAESEKPAVKDEARAGRPNVLFILSEDQGAHLSLLGTPGLKTPNIDSIAHGGVYFDNAFVAYPVCSASKAALYTGLFGHTNGILNNTHNYHKPASEVTSAERNRPLAMTNFVRDSYTTLVELLAQNDYYQGVTHKLHVLPNEKFPYDEFLSKPRTSVSAFLNRAKKTDRPWFLMVNLSDSHRPYPNSDKQAIRVDPATVQLPAYLPDTPDVRKDWAEYLAAIEQVDGQVGQTLQTLDASGESDNTIVIFMSDHGPTFQHGKMTLYDLGLRVPLIISGPGVRRGLRSSALVSEVDLFPTIVDLIERNSDHPLLVMNNGSGGLTSRLPYDLQGKSLGGILTGESHANGHAYVFAEISNRGPLPNDGIQERSVFDGKWKLIYREHVDRAWRQVNEDTRAFAKWGNRTYRETIRVKDRFPEAYRVLAEMDPQNLGGHVPTVELYDLENDPDEMKNLAEQSEHRFERDRLVDALRRWAKKTGDVSVSP
tara:strand:- start:390305 stop:395161 length:4857 start_codon:yes stop_codon:yes gene_type:complete